MRAVVHDNYGPPEVLRVKVVQRPVPKDTEVLIRVRASTVTSADCRVRSLRVPVGFGLLSRLVFGVRRPRQAILGVELAGNVLAGLPDMLPMPWVALTSSHRIIAGPAAGRAEDLRALAALAQAGTFKPVIDRRYPLEQIAEARRYVDSGRTKGNVVIKLADQASATPANSR